MREVFMCGKPRKFSILEKYLETLNVLSIEFLTAVTVLDDLVCKMYYLFVNSNQHRINVLFILFVNNKKDKQIGNGCRPDERNFRSGIFKTELCILCYYRERADHFKKN